MDMKLVKLESIKPSALNPRRTFNEGKMKELIASVEEKGILNPILLRPSNGKFEIVSGERRFRAATAAGLEEIPAVIRPLDDTQALECMIIENLQREDVHPLEEAEGYETLLHNHSYKLAEDIAAKVGKSKGYIYGRLKLCALTPDNRKLFYDNKFNPSVALLVARIPAHLQKEAGKKIATGGPAGEPMSYRAAMEFITKEYMLVLKEAPFDTDDALLIQETGSCTMCQKRTGNQKELFADVSSADVCTDPECFKAKKAAGVKRALAKAKESGKIVLSEKEAKKVFFSEDSLYLGEGYINLDAICEEDRQSRKYKQLVKAVKDSKVVAAVNPHSGELVALIHRTEASRIRKKLNINPPKKADKPAKASKEQEKDTLKREQEKEQARQAAAFKIIDEIIQSARRDTRQSFLRPMAESMCDSFLTPVLAVKFMKRREIEVKKDEAIEKVKEHLSAISATEVPIFCLELMMNEENEFDQESRLVKIMAKHYNIDTGRVKKVAADNAKKEETASAAPVKSEEKKEPEEAHVKMRDKNTFEYNGRGGKKVVVKAKSDMSLEDQQKAGKALKKVTDIFAEDK